LSPREIEVLRLVAAGKTNREIADALVISEHTVIRHLSNIFTKTGAENRAGAAAFGLRHRLV
jgi:DNA-binding CsgD family transcriptional regulator